MCWGVDLAAKPPPWQLPVVGYHLTARFGMVSGLWAHAHTGLDFAAPQGTPIHSIAPGRVTSTGTTAPTATRPSIRLDDGTVLWFCHQSAYAVDPVGERVSAGELIGYVGSTGNVTGPHLHLEVHPARWGADRPRGLAAGATACIPEILRDQTADQDDVEDCRRFRESPIRRTQAVEPPVAHLTRGPQSGGDG